MDRRNGLHPSSSVARQVAGAPSELRTGRPVLPLGAHLGSLGAREFRLGVQKVGEGTGPYGVAFPRQTLALPCCVRERVGGGDGLVAGPQR